MTTLTQFFRARHAEHIENGKILAKMTQDNRTYDAEFTAHLFESYRLSEKDTRTVMDIIGNVRADILQAQANELSAQDYFGMSASDLARKFIDGLPDKQKEQRFKKQVVLPIYFVIVFGVLFLSPLVGGGITKQNMGLFLLSLLFNMISWGIATYLPTWFFKLYPGKAMANRLGLINWLTVGFQVLFIMVILIIKYSF